MKKKKETLVIGIGGGGQNIVNQFKEQVSDNLRLLVINSDEQILKLSNTDTILFPTEEKIFKKFYKQKPLTKFKYFINNIFCKKPSLGCGGDVNAGENLGKKYSSLLKDDLKHVDKVFIISTFGGGFGTGVTPKVVDYIKRLNIKTTIIVTLPFDFEGKRRTLQADSGISKLNNENLIVINNNDYIKSIDRNASAKERFNLIGSDVIKKVADINKNQL